MTGGDFGTAIAVAAASVAAAAVIIQGYISTFTSRLRSLHEHYRVTTPLETVSIGCPELYVVWHGCSGCADCENTNYKKIVLAPSEILRC